MHRQKGCVCHGRGVQSNVSGSWLGGTSGADALRRHAALASRLHDLRGAPRDLAPLREDRFRKEVRELAVVRTCRKRGFVSVRVTRVASHVPLRAGVSQSLERSRKRGSGFTEADVRVAATSAQTGGG